MVNNSEGTEEKEKTRINQRGIDNPQLTRLGSPNFSNVHCQGFNPGLMTSMSEACPTGIMSETPIFVMLGLQTV